MVTGYYSSKERKNLSSEVNLSQFDALKLLLRADSRDVADNKEWLIILTRYLLMASVLSCVVLTMQWPFQIHLQR